MDDGLDNQNRRKKIANRALQPGSSFLSIAFIALDDSVTLDSDLGVQLSSLMIATPLLKDLILLSERGQDITKPGGLSCRSSPPSSLRYVRSTLSHSSPTH